MRYLILLLFVGHLSTAQIVHVPMNSNITPDGIYQAAEWQGAAEFKMAQAGMDSTTIRIAYDTSGIYVLAAGNLESNQLFPEVLINKKHHSSNAWVPGLDWFLHVSATDCESNQMYYDYSNCQLLQIGWIGEPNFQPGAPLTDTVEFFISFAKVGYTPGSNDSLGFAMVVTNTFNATYSWPAGSSVNDPSSWGILVLDNGLGTIGENRHAMRIYPNPVHDILTIENYGESVEIKVFDNQGKLVLKRQVTTEDYLNLSGLPKGLYHVLYSGENTRGSKTILKN